MKRTCQCGCGELSDGWPSRDGGEACQMCWERECSEAWWESQGGLLRLTDPDDGPEVTLP